MWSLAAMAEASVIDSVVLLVPPGREDEAEALLRRRGEVSLVGGVVAGGGTRRESVRAGLKEVDAGAVVCHDAARPFASPELFVRVVGALDRFDGVVPLLRSPDTVKRVQDGAVVETIPREEVGLAQTPQAFRAEVLHDVHSRAAGEGWEATDDAMLLERAGYRVGTVEGEPGNFKVTTADDLRRAERLVSGGGGAEGRE